MGGNKKLIIGGCVAGGAMVVMAGCVIGAGLAKGEPATPGENVPGYLQALIRDQVATPDTSKSVQIGRELCVQLRDGLSVEALARSQATQFRLPYSFTLVVTRDANAYLCPDAVPTSIRAEAAGRRGGGRH